MINTSAAYKQAFQKNNICTAKASILLRDGASIKLDSSSIMQNGVRIDDGVGGTDSFEIGNAIVNKLTLNINNMYDDFSDYDFTDAVITIWIGKELESGEIEWLKKGVFNSSDPTETASILTLECLDNMNKFNKTYDGNLSFPSTLGKIVDYCCTRCGVRNGTLNFDYSSYTVQENPFEKNASITYRTLISYCAVIAGCYARCNADGALELKWYDRNAFAGIIDAGEADNPATDVIDAGDFTPIIADDVIDPGEFSESAYHHIYSFSSLSIATEDVVITGIRVTASDTSDSQGQKLEGETYLTGVEGYVLEISGNPLIEYGKAKEVATYLATKIVGMRFRPMNASALGNPCWEAGDAALLTDRKGNSYECYLTNLTYSLGSYASISCDAQPAARHSADKYTAVDKIVSTLKKDTELQIKENNIFSQLATNAIGYYETPVLQEDGSMIKYMHDKPVLEDSELVYKKTIDGFFWSKDGGKTWSYGIDKNGNAVMNVISVIGLVADWIVAGKIADKTGQSYWDLDNGEFVMSGVFQQFNSGDGYKSVDIKNNALNVYSWQDKGNYVGSVGALAKKNNPNSRQAMGVYCDSGDILALGYVSGRDADGSAEVQYAIRLDSNNFGKPYTEYKDRGIRMNEIPEIYGTQNGDFVIGITRIYVSNGLIVSTGQEGSVYSGNFKSGANENVYVTNGVITGVV